MIAAWQLRQSTFCRIVRAHMPFVGVLKSSRGADCPAHGLCQPRAMSGLGCLGIDRHVDSRLDWQRSRVKKVDNYYLRLRGSLSRLYGHTFELWRELLALDAVVLEAVVLFLFSSLASRRFALLFCLLCSTSSSFQYGSPLCPAPEEWRACVETT